MGKMCRGMLVLLVLYELRACVASRVLVVFPVPSQSHAMLGDSVVKILLDAGHEVTYATPFSNIPATAKLTSLDISSVAEAITDRERLNLMDLVRNPRPPQRALEVGTTFARRVLQHESMQDLLLDPEVSFDAVLVEWFFSGLLAPLGTLFECPLIWYSAIDASWMSLQLMHEQSSPVYSVDSQARSMASPPFTTSDRVYRLWRQAYLTAWMYYMTYYVETPAYQKIYQRPLELRGRTLPEYDSLVYNGSFLLINSHPLLGQSLALPENAKYVGGHHLETSTKPLPKDLQDLLDNAKNGAIFFSLGSKMKSGDITGHMQRELVQIFGQLGQTVIWKFDGYLENLPENVHIVDWVPQKSILNHTNTLLLISHGGFMSYMEATYYGVPIIGIPFFGDQFVTADLAAQRGRGIRVDFSNELPHKIKEAINEILGNYRYHSNVAQASAIFQNGLVSPQKELVHWIEVVINTHGADHLRSPARRISAFERLHLDIVALIAMLFWFLSKVLKVIKVYFCSSEDENKKNN